MGDAASKIPSADAGRHSGAAVTGAVKLAKFAVEIMAVVIAAIKGLDSMRAQ